MLSKSRENSCNSIDNATHEKLRHDTSSSKGPWAEDKRRTTLPRSAKTNSIRRSYTREAVAKEEKSFVYRISGFA